MRAQKSNLNGFITVLILFMITISVHASSTCNIRGVNYTGWNQTAYSNEESNQSLENLKNIGCDWVAINFFYFQDNVNSTIIELDYAKYSVEPASVIDAIQYCHSIGLKVMLKPMVDCRDGTWRGQIVPSQGWFDSYRAILNEWAVIAESNNVELFCLGCEYVETVYWSPQWRQIISEVRDRYTGELTYAANVLNERNVVWWDDLDYIGTDPYYPLTELLDPTEQDLQDAWQQRADDLEDWLLANWPDKEIIFTEIGYQSCSGTNKTPWRIGSADCTIDLQEQVDCYKALLDQCQDRSWWRGVFWWNWQTDPNAGLPGTTYYPWHTPQNKPVEALLSNYYIYCNGFPRGDLDHDSYVDTDDLRMLLAKFLTSKPSMDMSPYPSGDQIINLQDFATLAKNWEGSPLGDLNHDSRVDVSDLIILSTNFLANNTSIDLYPYPSGDGIINLQDFVILTQNWNVNSQSDINKDSHVNLEDIVLLADKWLWTGICGSVPEDIFEDGRVNLRDFVIIAESWLAQ